MRVLRAADHRRMPWKNGGGETIEIAVHPHGAGLDDFDWRVSIARVASDGPFSAFEDVDRILVVLEGEGLELSVEGMGPHILTTRSDPIAFPADRPTAARLTAGPITDLNVMTRRGRATAALHRRRAGDDAPLLVGAGMVVALGTLRLAGIELGRHDALLFADPDEALALETQGGADLLHIALAPPPDRTRRDPAGRDINAIAGE